MNFKNNKIGDLQYNGQRIKYSIFEGGHKRPKRVSA